MECFFEHLMLFLGISFSDVGDENDGVSYIDAIVDDNDGYSGIGNNEYYGCRISHFIKRIID